MALGERTKRRPAAGVRMAGGLVLAVSGIQVMQAATAPSAHADDTNRAPDPGQSRWRDWSAATQDFLQRNVPITPDMVTGDPDSKAYWARKFVAWINQRVILESQLGVAPSGSWNSWVILGKDITYGVTSFLNERARAGETARTDAVRQILQERSSAISEYVSAQQKGPVSPETVQRYVTAEAMYQAVPEKYRHLETNDFAREVIDRRLKLGGSSSRVANDPVLRSRLVSATAEFQARNASGRMTDAAEYELYKASQATDPNISTKTLRSTNFVDWQQAKYGGQLPKSGWDGDWPRGSGDPGGDPTKTGPDGPKPVTKGPSGGAAEPARGTDPPETKPPATKPAPPAGENPSGKPASTTESQPGTAGQEPKPPTAAEAKPGPAPEEPKAPTASPTKPTSPTWDESGKVVTGDQKPSPAWDANGNPVEKPGGTAPEKPTAPKFTPGTVPTGTPDTARWAIKRNLALDVAFTALEKTQGYLTSDYVNWVARRAQQDPDFVDSYLRQYDNWQAMTWVERRQYELEHFFGGGVENLDQSAFFPEMREYMLALQSYYNPSAPFTPSMGPVEVPVAPYTGGAQTTDALNRETLGPDGQWHDRSRIYLLTDVDKAPPGPSPAPDQPETPKPEKSKPKDTTPDTTKKKPGPGQVGTAQQRVQEQMDEKQEKKKEEKKEEERSPDNKPNHDGGRSHSDNGQGGTDAGAPSTGGSSGGSSGGSGTSPGSGGTSGGEDTGGGDGTGGGPGSSSDPGPDSGNRGHGDFGGRTSGSGSDASKRV